MSTKWRRNKKRPKGEDHLDFNKDEDKDQYRFQGIKTLRTSRNIYPQKYWLHYNSERQKRKDPKPLVDVFQEKDWITIIAEIAGFNKETLKIAVSDQKLTLSAKGTDRRYYKRLNLPKAVNPNIVRTTFKNGVLEIKIKKEC